MTMVVVMTVIMVMVMVMIYSICVNGIAVGFHFETFLIRHGLFRYYIFFAHPTFFVGMRVLFVS
jgi:hypothetical protein